MDRLRTTRGPSKKCTVVVRDPGGVPIGKIFHFLLFRWQRTRTATAAGTTAHKEGKDHHAVNY
jgi:hypothetical protein